MTSDLRACSELRSFSQVVDFAKQPPSGSQRVLAQTEAVVRRREAVDVGEGRSSLPIEPEIAWRAGEVAPFEMTKEGMNVGGVGLDGAVHRVSDSHDAR